MNAEKKAQLRQYIETTVHEATFRLEGNVADPQGKLYPTRNALVRFRKYTQDFRLGNSEPRWIVMPGLRGVGKTTLMSQLYLNELPEAGVNKFFLTIDVIVRRFNANLWDVMEILEELMGTSLERLDIPTFFFFDEVQYDTEWEAAIKSFYDRSKKLYFMCTGSSATLLKAQLSGDSARRAHFDELFPMTFPEYILIRTQGAQLPIGNLGTNISDALFRSATAEDVYHKLKTHEGQVNQYWQGLGQTMLDDYIKFGSLPFTLTIDRDVVTLNYLEQMTQKMIALDLPLMGPFDQKSINQFPALIYMLAEPSSAMSLEGMLGALTDVTKDTLQKMLRALVTAGFLIKVPAYGSNTKQVRKRNKYFFGSPALRLTQLANRVSISKYEIYKGALLEDAVVLYLRRVLEKMSQNNSLTYDAAKGGADFIASVDDMPIVLEVGSGDKSFNQVETTLKKTGGKYGIVVCDTENPEVKNNAVKVPLRHFLLM